MNKQKKTRKRQPMQQVKRYIDGLVRTASKQKRRVLRSARNAMERLYGR